MSQVLTDSRVVGHIAKADRADEMLDAYNSGFSPREIAADFDVTVRCVYIRLGAKGVTFNSENSDKRRHAEIWSLPEDQRRVAFARKAAAGAREALKRNPPKPPLFTELSGKA